MRHLEAWTEAAFRSQLNALLKAFGAELSAKDHYQGYPECGEDIRMTVSIPAIYSKDTFELVMPGVEIDLGSWTNGNA